nr:hypothetical protein [Pseudomonas fragi]
MSDEILDPTTCNDQGRVKVATNNAELIHLSSTGLAARQAAERGILPEIKATPMQCLEQGDRLFEKG